MDTTALATIPTGLPWSFNVSKSSTISTCGPCRYLRLPSGTWGGGWYQNTTLPILRTIQEIVDPSQNTTSTSIVCNSSALPAYQVPYNGPVGGCESVTLSEQCELLCHFDELIDGSIQTSSMTFTGTQGYFLHFSGHVDMWDQDAISTTDSEGASTCITTWSTHFSSTFHYSGRITTTLEDGKYMRWLLPDLTSYFPGEGVYEQCTNVWQGPPPVALTAANEIVLPARTLSPSTATSTQASIASTALLPATAQPAGSGTSTTASRTLEIETTSTSSAGTVEGVPNVSPIRETTDGQEEQPFVSTTSAEGVSPPSAESGLGSEPGQEPAASQKPAPSQEPATSHTVSPTDPPLQSGSPEQQTHEKTSASHQVAPQSGETATQAQPLTAQDPAIPTSTTDKVGTNTAAPISEASAYGTSIRPISSMAQGYSLPGPTITEGGDAAVISGTSYSVLSSGLGVVAINNAGSSTLQSSQLASHGISTLSNSPNAYILPAQTLAADSPAVVVSGATYSALPEGSGFAVVSNAQTSVLAIPTPTTIPGIGQINPASADGYVLDGSVTFIAGEAAATISNTVYSALPSGFGVLVASDSGSDDFASYIAQGIGSTEQGSGEGGGYIIGIESLTASGRPAATVSGVVYSVLPSGSGVLVVAGGESTTIGVASTVDGSPGGGSQATSTGGSGDEAEESVAVFTGGSSSKIGYSAWQCSFVFGVMGLVVGLM